MAKATSPTYTIPFRRRRDGKTRYKKRLAYLKGKTTRLVVRKTNKQIIVQLVDFAIKGDKTKLSVTKKQLEAYGWPVRRNTPTAYLAGLLAGKLALEKGIKKAILDIGLQTPSKNTLVFAVAKGAKDAGLEIDMNAEYDESRVKGEHISNYAKKLKEENEAAYKKIFSSYLNAKIKPEELPKLFEEVKAKIKG